MADESGQSGTGQTEAPEDGTRYAPDTLAGGNGQEGDTGSDVNLDLVLDVPVNVALRVGQTEMAIRELVNLVEGSVIAFERDADQAVDVLVNGTLIAQGEIVVVDGRYGVRLTDVVSPAERIRKIN